MFKADFCFLEYHFFRIPENAKENTAVECVCGKQITLAGWIEGISFNEPEKGEKT